MTQTANVICVPATKVPMQPGTTQLSCKGLPRDHYRKFYSTKTWMVTFLLLDYPHLFSVLLQPFDRLKRFTLEKASYETVGYILPRQPVERE